MKWFFWITKKYGAWILDAPIFLVVGATCLMCLSSAALALFCLWTAWCIYYDIRLVKAHEREVDAMWEEHDFFLDRFTETGDRIAYNRAIGLHNDIVKKSSEFWQDDSFEKYRMERAER